MGPIVYHTHFAVFIEALLPIALFLALNEAAISYTMVGFSAVLLTAIVVSASRGGLVIACAEVIVVLVLSHLRKPKTGRKIAFVALALIGVTVVFALIVGFRDSIEAVLLRNFNLRTPPVRRFHPAYDRCASLDWVGTRLLACGISRLCHVRSGSDRQSGALRLVAVDGGRWVAGRVCHARAYSVGRKAGDSIHLGHRRDCRPHSRSVRLPVFSSGGRRVANSNSGYGSSRSHG